MKLSHIKILDELGLSDNQVDSLLMERIYGLEGMDRDAIIKYYMTLAAKKGERYFISFRGLKKDEPERLRMNYKADYESTPMGVYAYPLDKETFAHPDYRGFTSGYMMDTNGRFVVLKLNESSPTVIIKEGGEEYINLDINDVFTKFKSVLLKLNEEKPFNFRIMIRHASHGRNEISTEVLQLLVQMCQQLPDFDLNTFKHLLEQRCNERLKEQPFKVMYRIIVASVNKIGRQNLLLRYLGVHNILDYDESIHSNEPIQAVFLSPNSFTQIASDTNKRKGPSTLDAKASDRMRENFSKTFNGDVYNTFRGIFSPTAINDIIEDFSKYVTKKDDGEIYVTVNCLANILKDYDTEDVRKLCHTEQFNSFVQRRLIKDSAYYGNSEYFIERVTVYDIFLTVPSMEKDVIETLQHMSSNTVIASLGNIYRLYSGNEIIESSISVKLLLQRFFTFVAEDDVKSPEFWENVKNLAHRYPVLLSKLLEKMGLGKNLIDALSKSINEHLIDEVEYAKSLPRDIQARIDLLHLIFSNYTADNRAAINTFFRQYSRVIDFGTCVADPLQNIPAWLVIAYNKEIQKLRDFEIPIIANGEFKFDLVSAIKFDMLTPDFGKFTEEVNGIFEDVPPSLPLDEIISNWIVSIREANRTADYEEFINDVNQKLFAGKVNSDQVVVFLVNLSKYTKSARVGDRLNGIVRNIRFIRAQNTPYTEKDDFNS